MLIDAHCHLHFVDFDDTRDQIITTFDGLCVTVWVDYHDSMRALACAQQYDLKCTVWVHPLYTTGTYEQLHVLAQDPHVIAIWECGTDLHHAQSHGVQKQSFDMQCRLARDCWLPIMIHSRDDFEGTFDVVRYYPDVHVYRHCWTYGISELQQIMDTFEHYRIGVWGIITYKNTQHITDAIKHCGIYKIFVETDSPYLTPVPHRGTLNQPKYTAYIYQKIAEIFDISIQDLDLVIQQNHRSFWGIFW